MEPRHEEHWFETYARIARTGRPEHFTLPLRHRWYEVQAARIGEPDERRVGVLFRDVTGRKRAEERLRRNEAKQALLLQLSDALRTLGDPVEIQGVAARLLGEHVHARRVYYSEIDEASGLIRVDVGYARTGAAVVVGLYRYENFRWVGPAFREGAPAVLDDVRVSPVVPDEQRGALEAFGTRAVLAIPLVKGGRL